MPLSQISERFDPQITCFVAPTCRLCRHRVAAGGRFASSSCSWRLSWRLPCCGCGILPSGSRWTTSGQMWSYAWMNISDKWPSLNTLAVFDQYDLFHVSLFIIEGRCFFSVLCLPWNLKEHLCLDKTEFEAF